MSSTDQPPSILVDAHVHLYDCFDRVAFFDTARANFRRAAQSLSLPADTPGVLLLTETSKDHAFESLIAQHELPGGAWRFHPSAEGCSLIAQCDGQDVLALVAGRQVVTHEGLEVLALCCNEQFNDDRPIEHTIGKIVNAGGLPVLPYGVGKWSGARGVIISKLLEGPLASRLLLGDNAGRLSLAPEPAHFKLARDQGLFILPGTDPLPFAAQAGRVGTYGMRLTGPFDPDKPAASIRQRIQTADTQPTVYGRTDGPVRFFNKQLRMQLRKRLSKR